MSHGTCRFIGLALVEAAGVEDILILVPRVTPMYMNDISITVNATNGFCECFSSTQSRYDIPASEITDVSVLTVVKLYDKLTCWLVAGVDMIPTLLTLCGIFNLYYR